MVAVLSELLAAALALHRNLLPPCRCAHPRGPVGRHTFREQGSNVSTAGSGGSSLLLLFLLLLLGFVLLLLLSCYG